MNMDLALLEKTVELIFLSAREKKIKKAIFSKPLDKTLQKVVLTSRINRQQIVLQAETFHKDNKVTHKNFLLTESSEELSMFVNIARLLPAKRFYSVEKSWRESFSKEALPW